MYHPSKEEFIRLSRKGNLIPVYKQILADLETPVSAFLKIDQGDYSYLLESVEGAERVARYSFLGSNPSLIFKGKGDKDEPLVKIKRLMSKYKFVPMRGLPRFCGGLVGYIGYDVVRFFEPRLKVGADKIKDDLRLPDILFVLTDTIIIFDHIAHKIKVVSNAYIDGSSLKKIEKAYNEAINKINKIVAKLKKPPPIKYPTPRIPGLPNSSTARAGKDLIPTVKSNFTKNKFKESVLKAKEYIRAGDIIQVVLSQRFKLKLNCEPFDVYRALRSINPSPYMYYLKYKDLKLIGSSPELLVRCEEGIVETRPIAGTRPRGKDEVEDKKLTEDLIHDSKERAEHLMLVDLGRNDLGRVCVYGSVKTQEFMVIEKYSHVMHLVSGIVGKLAKGKDIYDVLRASFPAGTVTGAPKIRAMEIIDELEKLKRGPYAGCVGYFSFSGNLDTCITIRTIVIKDDSCFIQAGAGIVADSKPENEYYETVNKAKAQIRAIEMAQGGKHGSKY
jgi:anthranilate synthase component 1